MRRHSDDALSFVLTNAIVFIKGVSFESSKADKRRASESYTVEVKPPLKIYSLHEAHLFSSFSYFCD